MKLHIRPLTIALLIAAGSTQAATVDESGYGIVYGIGVNTFGLPGIREDDGARTSVSETASIGNDANTDQSGSVRGDLRTGEIGARSTSVVNGPTAGNDSYSEVKLFDTLTFDLTGQAPGDVVDIEIALDWEGSIKPFLSNRGDDFAWLSFGLTSEDDTLRMNRTVGTGNFNLVNALVPGFQVGDALDLNSIATLAVSNRPNGFVGDWANTAPALKNPFSGTFSLATGKVTEVEFQMGLFVSGNTDFFNSVHLGFDTTADYTSASGAFLTAQNVAPVPLPSSGLLLLAGIGAIAMRRRRNTA